MPATNIRWCQMAHVYTPVCHIQKITINSFSPKNNKRVVIFSHRIFSRSPRPIPFLLPPVAFGRFHETCPFWAGADEACFSSSDANVICHVQLLVWWSAQWWNDSTCAGSEISARNWPLHCARICKSLSVAYPKGRLPTELGGHCIPL